MSSATQGSASVVRVGTGPLSLLGVAFVVLKLTDNIDWSWLWVLAPFWIPWAIVLFILVFFGIGVLIVALLDSHDDRKRRKLKQERLKQQSLRR
jgi:hypothetical protein